MVLPEDIEYDVPTKRRLLRGFSRCDWLLSRRISGLLRLLLAWRVLARAAITIAVTTIPSLSSRAVAAAIRTHLRHREWQKSHFASSMDRA